MAIFKKVKRKVSFKDLNVNEQILRALDEMQFKEPTPVQRESIPLLLQGNDLIAQAKTGTGKTAAFGIPIIQTLEEKREIQSLILVPTRELAVQVVQELRQISKHCRISILAIYGGDSMERQIRELERGVQIVVATPGRMLDHLERRTVELSKVRFAVLDEADRMLDMGFIDDVKKIFGFLPKHRQTALFSATMPQEISQLAKQTMNSPELLQLSGDNLAVDNIKQEVAIVDDKKKVATLATLLDAKKPQLTIIFVKTKRTASWLNECLRSRNFNSVELHGDLTQNKRERAVHSFKNMHANVLVATDIAARGLDIDNVELIVNFNVPDGADTYVHRIGRTARAGKKGDAITFATNLNEKRDIERIARQTNSTISEIELQADEKFLHGSRPSHDGESGPQERRHSYHSRGHGGGYGGGHGGRSSNYSGGYGGQNRRPRRSNGYNPSNRRY